MNAEHARLLARYNAWMNDKLYAACAALSDEERKRDRGAFFRSIHGTLNHLLLADLVWMGRFQGQPFAFRSLDQELCPTFDELRARRTELDERIQHWAAGLTDAAHIAVREQDDHRRDCRKCERRAQGRAPATIAVEHRKPSERVAS